MKKAPTTLDGTRFSYPPLDLTLRFSLSTSASTYRAWLRAQIVLPTARGRASVSALT